MGDHTAWAQDRQNMPVYGLAFAPRTLPAPHVYGARSVVDRFDPRTQGWTTTALPASWSQARDTGGFQVQLRGRLPAP